MALPINPEERLAALGLALPEPAKPVAAYIPWRRVGNLIFTAGQIPTVGGQLLYKGSIPGQVTLDQGRECAVQCLLNGLAVLKAAAGSLAALRRVVRVGCFVCSEPGFHDQPKVANGCSELLVELFGEPGKHVRSAVGSVALPLGAPVEIEFVFEVE